LRDPGSDPGKVGGIDKPNSASRVFTGAAIDLIMVKIYSTPFCPYCATLKEYLTHHNVEYTDVDVSSNEQERDEMIKLSGQIGVPVVVIDGKVIVGFDKEAIDTAAKINVKK